MTQLKRLLFILIFIAVIKSSLFCLNDNTTDKRGVKKLTKLEIFTISYWSSYGVTGLTALINSFAHLGSAYAISNELNDIIMDLRKYNADPGILDSFSANYPGILFGMHFITSGLAFIPVAGGIVYGASLYLGAITLSILNAMEIVDFEVDYGHSYDLSSYEDKVKNVYRRIMDSTSYFVVGSISIIFGIADIIMWFYYNKEIKRNKFPYQQRSFTFLPGSLTFKINL
ncbi:MAG: hypothetical protein JXB50_13620 [Spirochaetes bacterium]|nr:hypothetical protein [Spirochaetota bacterium]